MYPLDAPSDVAPQVQFHPLIAEWFSTRVGEATEPQIRAWAALADGRDALVSAPTGSGKTLAAFLVALDRLVRQAASGALADETQVLYVSPLKALSNDIHRNLERPLAEIAALAEERRLALAPIRVAVRTGDTPVWERAQMVRRAPHILVTTPESLFILLTAERSRAILRSVRTLIVDEIHAIADDKRGAHLSLSLARLEALIAGETDRPLQRIGLSATVKPIRLVAQFLKPSPPCADGEPPGPGVAVLDFGHRRDLDLEVEIPRDELGVVATNEMWGEIYDRLAELIGSHRTTLVFVNTRRLAERVAHHLAERLGEEAVLAHHGSLSRPLRQTAEARLKAGALQAVVATASLELGIDIGSVDLVCQIGSPRSIAVALQRIGRSGHVVSRDRSRRPKGRLFATTRDELIECIALVRAIRAGQLDALEVPAWPRDVLAQQIVAACAAEPWREDDLFAWIRRTHSYAALPRAEFEAVLEMLSEGIATARGRSGAYLHRDRVNHIVRGRRGARLAAITSGGAIPDNANYLVVAEPEGATVGTVDEDFAVESLAGDVFLLGTTSWRIRRIEAGRVRVEDAHGAAPSIPFWRGEAPGRTAELSLEVSRTRHVIAEAIRLEHAEPRRGSTDPAGLSAVERLVRDEGLDRAVAAQAVDYVRAGCVALGRLPGARMVVAERFFDEGGGMQLVVHAPFGARINRAWGLALRKRFCRSFNFELQAAATDNGIVISLAEQHSFPLEVIFRYLNVDTVEPVLTQALLDSPMFTARWRWNASRALAILRFAGGRKVPPPLQRMRADDLLASVFPDQAACAENLVGEIRIPDHPLVNETIRDCLHEAMDVDGLAEILAAIDRGEIETAAVDTAEPSPFSHELLNANPYAFLDDAPLEERRARAVQMRRTLGRDGDEIGSLDAQAIAEVERESWPIVRDADELHDGLLTLLALPPVPTWAPFFQTLAESGRATCLEGQAARVWVAAERLAEGRLLYGPAREIPPIEALDGPADLDRDGAATRLVRGWLESTGPQTAAALASRLALPVSLVEGACARLESDGQILRGRFTPGQPAAETEWCNRRLLARIHRLTLGRLRREIEPVSAAIFVHFLSRWQHLAPGTQLHGADGLVQVLGQLQGYEISAAAWEPEILTRRIAAYSGELLDQLCLAGEVMWGRVSPHPAFGGPTDLPGEAARTDLGPDAPGMERARRRVRPTRVAPVTVFLREDAEWLLRSAPSSAPESTGALSHAALAVLRVLQQRGASFLPDLVRASGRLATEVEDGLWELVTAGLVTADGFDNLRALIDPKRRRGEGRRGRLGRARHVAGRWALLRSAQPAMASGAPAPPSLADEAQLERFARQLLRRWGVVFRDLLARESLAPPWRDVLRALRRLEARGEIRGGRFVVGFVGDQFARPEALELLRVLRRREPSGEHLSVAAADPLNLLGIILPGPRVSALAGERVQLLAPARSPEDSRAHPVLAAAARASSVGSRVAK